jgi:hypothetical protein
VQPLLLAWRQVASKRGPAADQCRSSSLARELFTLFETGHRCSTSFAAGLSNTPTCGVLNGHVGAEVKRGDAQGRGPVA